MIKTKKIIKRVGFFGDAEAKVNDEHFKLAKETAYLLAKEGYIVVNGGGPGVMKAATLGAKEAGGKVELVILNQEKEPGNYEGVDQENFGKADKVYKTENYSKRLGKLIKIADAFVVFKGGSGTLSEVGLTWELAKFDYGKHEPLIFVGKEWQAVVASIEKNMNFEKKEKQVVVVVEKPKEVVEELKKLN